MSIVITVQNCGEVLILLGKMNSFGKKNHSLLKSCLNYIILVAGQMTKIPFPIYLLFTPALGVIGKSGPCAHVALASQQILY